MFHLGQILLAISILPSYLCLDSIAAARMTKKKEYVYSNPFPFRSFLSSILASVSRQSRRSEAEISMDSRGRYSIDRDREISNRRSDRSHPDRRGFCMPVRSPHCCSSDHTSADGPPLDYSRGTNSRYSTISNQASPPSPINSTNSRYSTNQSPYQSTNYSSVPSVTMSTSTTTTLDDSDGDDLLDTMFEANGMIASSFILPPSSC